MTPEIKQRWIKALRSGAYKQGREFLEDKTGKCCCLGVLANVCGVPKSIEADAFIFYFPTPFRLQKHGPPAGFQGLTDEHINFLIRLNDGRRLAFPAIADYIEANIPTEASHE